MFQTRPYFWSCKIKTRANLALAIVCQVFDASNVNDGRQQATALLLQDRSSSLRAQLVVIIITVILACNSKVKTKIKYGCMFRGGEGATVPGQKSLLRLPRCQMRWQRQRQDQTCELPRPSRFSVEFLKLRTETLCVCGARDLCLFWIHSKFSRARNCSNIDATNKSSRAKERIGLVVRRSRKQHYMQRHERG